MVVNLILQEGISDCLELSIYDLLRVASVLPWHDDSVGKIHMSANHVVDPRGDRLKS